LKLFPEFVVKNRRKIFLAYLVLVQKKIFFHTELTFSISIEWVQ
jgi:hypothetical protein